MEEMIETVRAALGPGADLATKQRAAAILRGLLTMVESGSAPSAFAHIPAGEPAASSAPTVAATVDVMGAILERLRPLLPSHVVADMPRFRVPIVGTKG